jgi:hypothetical protein
VLITLQFPLSDLRPFIAPKSRLPRPHWPTPDASSEFVRFFGKVSERRRSQVAWFDENTYCRAANAIKIHSPSGSPNHRVAFRRFFSDGRSVGRVEVGISFPLAPILSAPGLLERLGEVLDLNCVTRDTRQSKPLVAMGKSLARLYQAGTQQKSMPSTEDSVVAGAPCVVVEFERELDNLPMSIDFQRPKQGLAFSKLLHRGAEVGTWYISKSLNSRMLRLCLLRLHAEHQALKNVLWAIRDGRIDLHADSVCSDAA